MLIDEDWLIGHASVWALVNVTHSEGVARAFGEWLCNEFEGCELEEVPGHRASWAVFVASPEGVSALADWDAELDLVGLS